MLTAVVDFPTPPLPDATAMIAPTPGTPAFCAPAPAGGCACPCAWEGPEGWAALGGGVGLVRGGGVRPGWPGRRSAVSATITVSTPGTSRTAVSAALRIGSSSCARSAGTVTENMTFPSEEKMSDTRPSSTILPLRSGPRTRRSASRTWSFVTSAMSSPRSAPQRVHYSRDIRVGLRKIKRRWNRIAKPI